VRYARAVASSSPVARTRSSTNCVTAAAVGAPSQRGVVARDVALASGAGQAEVWRQRLYLCISSIHLYEYRPLSQCPRRWKSIDFHTG
jgi:hypothetical protein